MNELVLHVKDKMTLVSSMKITKNADNGDHSVETCSQNGTIRLKDGQNSREGRLEICLGGYWGSVCSAGWTKQNTLVACRQLGYKTLRKFAYYSRSFQVVISLFRSFDVN